MSAVSKAVSSRLSLAGRTGRAAPPVRIVHLGLGSFFRAHPCWYTEHASDAAGWGIAAFTGRANQALVEALNEQDGLYTLITRGSDADAFEVLSCLVRAHAAADHEGWLRYFEAPDLAAVTITVTEAGYLSGGGRLDAGRAEVQADARALRRDPTALVRTAPARLVAGLAARRRAGAGPLALVPCDNIPGNGALAGRVLADLADLVDPALRDWMQDSVSVVTTVVDRITPRPASADVRTVLESTGRDDRCPVVTEPFREWVLSGTFPAGRPRWEDAGALVTDDAAPYEHRKIWMLNGAHSLLAYAGSIRGHATVADAAADETCREWLEEWWDVASAHLGQPAELTSYRAALVERFGNIRIADRLDRIAADGSQKLPIRILPAVRAERAADRLPAAATRVLAAWVCHLRGLGAPVSDARADEVVPLAAGPLGAAVPRVLGWLDQDLGADADLIAVVIEQGGWFARTAAPRRRPAR